MTRYDRAKSQQKMVEGKCQVRVPHHRMFVNPTPMGQKMPWVSYPCGKNATKGTDCCDAHQVRP